jgi:Holliday junction resolvasome RuvABC endonuclease subunit
MVMTILGLKVVPTAHHVSDALAVAICDALSPPLIRVAS